MSEAAANGVRLALLVSGSPGWANGQQSALQAPNAADYAGFMAAASRRYPAVKRWMVWGEPNREDRFLPNQDGSPVGPRAYALILDAAYAALKSVSSKNIVIGGMTWTGGTVKPARFLEFMKLPNGRPPRLDWFGHNPFPFRFPNLRRHHLAGGWRDISDMDLFTRELRRVYGPKARLWLSEYTVLSERPSDTFALAVSRAQQARWLTASYALADDLRSVAGLGWLSLADEPDYQGSSRWGLLTASGDRKPAYEAYRRAPAVRFRPRVRVAREITRQRMTRPGLRVLVRPKLAGRITAELRTMAGRRLARTRGRARMGQTRRLRLRHRRARPGRYTLVIRTPRSESIRRTLRIR